MHISKQILRIFIFCSNISSIDAEKVLQVTEFVRFVSDVIQTFPGNITENGWDFIRIAISSWVLTLSKTSEHWKNPKVNDFEFGQFRHPQFYRFAFEAFITELIMTHSLSLSLYCRLLYLHRPYTNCLKCFWNSLPKSTSKVHRVR